MRFSPILFLCTLFLPFAASAQDDFNIEKVSILDHWAATYSVDTNGEYACVATGSSGLRVVDISDPAYPIEVGSFVPSTIVFAVDVVEDLAYVAAGNAGLRIVDISDPAHPAEIGFCNTAGSASGVQVVGDSAYVADGVNGLVIVDVSSPANPAIVHVVDTSGGAVDVDVSGGYAYVADYGGGFVVISLAGNPHIVESVNLYHPAVNVTINGEYAYVCEHTTLHVFDISTPWDIEQVAIIGGIGVVLATQVVDNTLIIAATDGLQLVDVNDPANPIELSLFPTTYRATGVAVSGTTACVAEFNSTYPELGALQLIDISDPTIPAELAAYNSGRGMSVVVSGDYAYEAAHEAGLRIIDVSNRETPVLTGYLATPELAYDVAVQGDFAYIADGYGGFRVVDVSDREHPVEISVLNEYWHPYTVSVDGDYAYITASTHGIYIIDITDPYNPTEISHFAVEDRATDLLYHNGLIYYSAYSRGMRVLDVSDPADPALIGQLYFGAGTVCWDLDVDIENGIAFAGLGNQGLAIVEVSDPSQPMQLSTWTGTNVYYNKVLYAADHVYLPISSNGIWVVNVSDLAAPVETGYYSAVDYASDVFVDGHITYLADHKGLQILDCTDAINAPSLIDVSLFANDDLIVPRGGGFQYGFVLSSNMQTTQPVDIWTFAVLPNGSIYGPLWQINNFPLAPATQIGASNISQGVPAFAPLGEYVFRLQAGQYPTFVAGEDEFPFEVVEGP